MQKGRFRDSADSARNISYLLLMIKIVIEDLYEISILVSYVTKSSLPLVLSVDLPDKFKGDSACSSAIFPLMAKSKLDKHLLVSVRPCILTRFHFPRPFTGRKSS